MPSRPELLAAALAERYRIIRELGMGGMATVYLADDLKHDRKVALKVLKPELAAVLGAERFVVEIKTTASLQHPHILPLFDSGSAEGFLYYVMPYIEGETLRDKLNRETQLGIDDAVRIAREVADALDYAHRHGVIHRDIKPENILLHDGRPMVADFGIALALSAAAGGRMTETGLSLGTPHYMSPEQATGEKDITARADVYSLASVLYEMLAGEPPHMGGSAQQIIMKIIAEPVQAVTKVRKSVPANVAAALAKALEKLPADRFDSAKAFSDALGNPAFTIASMAAPSSGFASSSSRAFVGLAAASVLLLGAALWGWLRPHPTPPVVRYQLTQALLPIIGNAPLTPTPSPDGSFIVFQGLPDAGQLDGQLWIKRRDRADATPIAETRGALSFAISPDGQSIAFANPVGLKRVSVAGGTAVTLVTNDVAGALGVAWLDDNTIVFTAIEASKSPMLKRVSASGGPVTVAWRSDSLGAVDPEPIAGKQAVLFRSCTSSIACHEFALDLRSGKAHEIMAAEIYAQYAVGGYLVYAQHQRLFAVGFDADRLEVRGEPVALADSISGGAFPLRLGRSGTFVSLYGGSALAGNLFEMVWVDRAGRTTPVDTSWAVHLTANGNNHGWALSPDDSRLAIGLFAESGDHVWVKQLPRGVLQRVTNGAEAEFRPRWRRDGRSVMFISSLQSKGVQSHHADGTGADSVIYAGTADEAMFSPDDEWLIFRIGSVGSLRGGRDIVGVRRGQTKRDSLIVTQYDEEAVAISPDGKWIAYQSDETGKTQIFIRPFPNTNASKRQVSNGGGEAPLWSRDGRELFFLGGGHNMMAVSVTPGATLALGEPRTLFPVAEDLLQVEYAFYTPWDVAKDGRFIMARKLHSAADKPPTTIVAENWLQELKAKMRR